MDNKTNPDFQLSADATQQDIESFMSGHFDLPALKHLCFCHFRDLYGQLESTGKEKSEYIRRMIGHCTRRDLIPQLITALNEEYGKQQKKAEETRTAYLNWRRDKDMYLDVRGVEQVQRQVQVKLENVYVSLSATPHVSERLPDRLLRGDELENLSARAAITRRKKAEADEEAVDLELWRELERRAAAPPAPVDVAEAVARRTHLAILGDPGSGKTTLLRYLSRTTERFPIYARIASFAENGEWRTHSLSDFLPIACELDGCPPDGLPALLNDELAKGGALVLLDGLDEIANPADRSGIVRRIEDFVRLHGTAGNRFILTSRIAGYWSYPLGEPFAHFTIQDMSDAQVEQFLNRWCREVENVQTPDQSEAEREAKATREIDGVLGAFKESPGVRRLAVNPLMLTILALIHRTGARLPQKRVELYKLAAKTLSKTWQEAKGLRETLDEGRLTQLLAELAFWMHENKPTGLATRGEVVQIWRKRWAELEGLNPKTDRALIENQIDDFLERVRRTTGLFVERAPGRYGFMHLTFEEYYAAVYVAQKDEASRARIIRKYLHKNRWREVILLALGFIGIDFPDQAAELVDVAILAKGKKAERLGFAPSAYEDLLARDCFFALRCAGDLIPLTPATQRELVERASQDAISLARYGAYQSNLAKRLRGLRKNETAGRIASAILPALVHEDEAVRSRAAESLGELGKADGAVIEGLVKALGDKDIKVRSRAAESLGELGKVDGAAIAGLVKALGDESINVWSRAAASLGQLGKADGAVIEGLVKALGDKDGNVRYRAAASLVQLGKVDGAVIEGLVKALGDKDGNVRYRAAESLVQLGKADGAVIEGLVKALGDKDENVWYRAAASLGQLGKADGAVIEGLVKALGDKNMNVRSRAAASLGQLGKADGAVIKGLIKALEDEKWDVQSRAAASLGQLGKADGAVIEGLVKALGDENWAVRSRAAASLGQLGKADGAVIEGLVKALGDTDIKVRSRAAESLVQLGKADGAVIEGLVKALGDTGIKMRSRAAESLVQLGKADGAVIEGLVKALGDENWAVRYRAAESLGQLGKADGAVIEGLVKVLGDKNWDVRSRAAASLGQLGKADGAVIEVLVKALGDKNWDVRSRAAASLGQLAKSDEAWVESAIPHVMVMLNTAPSPNQDWYHDWRDEPYSVLWQLVVGSESK